MQEEIIINISPSGEMEITANGYKGKTCKDATEFLEKMGSVEDVTLKPEYRQQGNTVGQRNYLRGN